MQATTRIATNALDVLTAKCPKPGDHDRFVTAPFMDVVVENIGRCNLGSMYSIAHYFEQNGDLMRDPEMCMIRGDDGEYYPYYYRLDSLGIEQNAVRWNEKGDLISIRIDLQKEQTIFCNSWMRNIKDQQEAV